MVNQRVTSSAMLTTATLLGLVVTICATYKLDFSLDYESVGEVWTVQFGDIVKGRRTYDNTDLGELLQLVLDELTEYTD